MNITLAFTPCPNDTFMLYALLHRKIQHNLNIESVILDIEQLNKHALSATYDVTKASAALFPGVSEVYDYLQSGGAFGIDGGPLLVSLPETTLHENSVIALPGAHTTAAALFNYYYTKPCIKNMLRYDHIIPSIIHGQCDAGVIIHEDRFQYSAMGLTCVMDMGTLWKAEISLPLPLGIFLCKKKLGSETIQTLDNLLKESVLYAFEHFDEAMEWACQMSSGKDREVIRKHIEYYVTGLSASMGKEGQASLEYLWRIINQSRR